MADCPPACVDGLQIHQRVIRENMQERKEYLSGVIYYKKDYV